MEDSSIILTFCGVYLVIIAFYIYVMWRLFVKAGESGWLSIIPILNAYVMIKIAQRPGWWFLLYLVPIVNFVIGIIVIIDFCKAYGKSTAYGVLTLFFAWITLPIMAFDDSKYIYEQGKALD